MPHPDDTPDRPRPPWAAADDAFAALERALKTAAVESGSGDGFDIATSHLRKVTDMRVRFADRRPVVERTRKEG